MEIASLFSIYETQYGSEIQSSSRRKEEKNNQSSTSNRDTVNISQEARDLLAKMLAEASGSGRNSTGKESKNPNDSDMFGLSDEQKANVVGGLPTASEEAEKDVAGSGGSGGGGEEDQVKDIKEKIEKLSAQIKSVMSSNVSPETRQTQAAPLQQQIAELEQQLAKLQTSQLGK